VEKELPTVIIIATAVSTRAAVVTK